MNDLLARIEAELNRLELIATAAVERCTDGHWRVDHRAGEVRTERPHDEGSGGERGWLIIRAYSALDDEAIVEHIAANDPAAVLARIAGERDVLARHQRVEFVNGCSGCGYDAFSGCDCCGPDLREQWPCPEVRAVARRLGLDQDGADHA